MWLGSFCRAQAETKNLPYAGLQVFISKSIATVHKSYAESIHNAVCVFFTNVGIISEVSASSDVNLKLKWNRASKVRRAQDF